MLVVIAAAVYFIFYNIKKKKEAEVEIQIDVDDKTYTIEKMIEFVKKG